MSASSLRRPADEAYYVAPWSPTFLQGDLFKDVPIAIAAPPDALVIDEGERRFVSGPFDAGPAMLISPSCAIAAQRADAAGRYAHPARILLPIRSVEELVKADVIPDANLGHLRADRLRNYLYLPARKHFMPESAALLYMPVTVHHDVIAESRVAQLSGEAFWHLRVKLMAFFGSFLLDVDELGPAPDAMERAS